MLHKQALLIPIIIGRELHRIHFITNNFNEMKNGIRLLILMAVLLFFSNCKKNKVDIVYNNNYVKEIKSLREELAFYLERNFIPGGSFAIAKDGEIIYSEGIGYASKELNVKVNRGTKFRIADVSELYTSAIYQLMIQDGILNPDSTVQYYLPDFPQKKYKLTLSDLANHTSGLRKPTRDELDWKGSTISLENRIDYFKNDTLLYEPGYTQYSTAFDYDLLGAVIEKVSQKPFPTLLKEYITEPLNLSNTEVDNPFKNITGRTNYFDNNIIALTVNAEFCDLRSRASSEGLLSNAEDLVKFGNAFLNSDIFTEEVKDRIFTPVTLTSGEKARFSNGWVLTKTKEGRTLYGMAGSVIGGGATLLIFPDEKLVIGATINLTSEMNDLPVKVMSEPIINKN